ncbi:MAG: TonB-dependent receptor [Phenylobacterium sp.]|nr:TonB-dependent receptor [Phenylobacterium sp.]
MILMKRLAAGAAMSALMCAASSAVYAQEITGGVAGTVRDAAGKPAAGAAIAVSDSNTGQTVSTVSSGDGFYTVRNLPVGGDFTVKATLGGATRSAKIGHIPIGAPYQLNISFTEENAVSEVVVTGTRAAVANALVQTGPRSTFTADDIEAAPTFARDLKDLIRINPFVTIDPTNSNAVVVAGANSRTNTIYVDGVRQSDDFGLNNGGYPTQRSPFSIDIVQAFNFEVAPYDVQYGNFQGGILNIVTKSGSNEFHGSAFFEQDSNRTAGHTIGARAFDGVTDRAITTKFKDQNRGFTIGGPIWKDHLFFFGSYEKFTGMGGAGGFVPGDVAGANPIPAVTSADVQQVRSILKTKYGYDPLNFGGSGPIVDEKWFGKLDWYITDNQHLFVTYQQTDGTSYNVPNGSVSTKTVDLQSNDYSLEQRLTAWTADLVSHWNRDFTTEIEYSRKQVQTPSNLFTGPFAQFSVQLPSTGQILLGPDISRQANNLGNVDKQLKVHGSYTLGDMVLSAGYEHEDLQEFDLFVQNATGSYTFSSGCGSFNTITNLQNGVACRLTYQNAFDNNPATAAGIVTYHTDTLYMQDEWRPMPELTLRAGLRYERYTTGDVPRNNPRFFQQYAFANTGTIDGLDLWMPRFGFNWQPDRTLTLTGGFGLFSGGNPGVWLYNSFQNTGNILGTRTYTCSTATCTGPLLGVTGSSIPASAQTDITNSANLGTGNANALDLNFKPPSTWKASLSALKIVDFSDYGFLGRAGSMLGDDWRFHADAYYSKVKEGVNFQDIWALQNLLPTPAPDGRPVYNPTRYTNALNRTSGSDILLTNTTQGDAKIVAVGFGKDWSDGWAKGLGFDYTFTHQRVREVTPATSSVATSNYNNIITADPNHPELATSNYEIRWENKLSVSYKRAFFGDNNTTFRLFAYNRAGLPYSYAFCTTNNGGCVSPSFSGSADQLFGQANTSTNHQLLYLPAGANGVVTATSDPRVTYGPNFDLAAFNAFIQARGLQGYEGQIIPRNAFHSKDVASADLHIAQEFPAFFPNGAKGEIYLDIINLGNLINKNWGAISQVGFPYALAPVVAKNCQLVPAGAPGKGTGATQCVAGQGNYFEYTAFKPGNLAGTLQVPTSPPTPTWVVKLGVRYKF